MTLFEYRERQLGQMDAVSWDVIEIEDVTVTEEQLEPAELERLKAEWIGRTNGTPDRVG